MRRGNFNPQSEFNVFSDPEAASIVFKCGLDVFMVPFDVAEQMQLSTPNRQMFQKLFSSHVNAKLIMNLLNEHSKIFINKHLFSSNDVNNNF